MSKNNNVSGNGIDKDFKTGFEAANKQFSEFKNDFLKLYSEFEQILTQLVIGLADVKEFADIIKRPPSNNDLRSKKITDAANRKTALQDLLSQLKEPLEVLLSLEDMKDRLNKSAYEVLLSDKNAPMYYFHQYHKKRGNKLLEERVYSSKGLKVILEELKTNLFLFLQIAQPLMRKLH